MALDLLLQGHPVFSLRCLGHSPSSEGPALSEKPQSLSRQSRGKSCGAPLGQPAACPFSPNPNMWGVSTTLPELGRRGMGTGTQSKYSLTDN